jgi:HSP20 family protein
LTVEENVLTVKAERPVPRRSDGIESVIAERPYGTFTRQVFLGTNLDTENIRADYEAGVLTVAIAVAEQAKPRRIAVSAQSGREELAT